MIQIQQITKMNKLYTKTEKKFTGFGIFIAVILFPIGILLGFLMRQNVTSIKCEVFFEDGRSLDILMSEEEFSRVRREIQLKTTKAKAA